MKNKEITSNLTLGNCMAIRLTKPTKRGRPSKEDKRIYGIIHTICIPEDTPQEEKGIKFQEQIDKLKLPVKLI